MFRSCFSIDSLESHRDVVLPRLRVDSQSSGSHRHVKFDLDLGMTVRVGFEFPASIDIVPHLPVVGVGNHHTSNEFVVVCTALQDQTGPCPRTLLGDLDPFSQLGLLGFPAGVFTCHVIQPEILMFMVPEAGEANRCSQTYGKGLLEVQIALDLPDLFDDGRRSSMVDDGTGDDGKETEEKGEEEHFELEGVGVCTVLVIFGAFRGTRHRKRGSRMLMFLIRARFKGGRWIWDFL